MHRIEEYLNKFTDEKILKRSSSKVQKTKGSMAELLWGSFSRQSTNIIFGHVIEASFNALIPSKYYLGISHIRPEAETKRIQLDILFMKDNVVYYFESKNNINLDTEKMPACIEKISKVKTALASRYPEYVVVAKILTSRFPTTQAIPREFFKNGLTNMNVIGYNDFFEIIGEETINEEEWCKIIRRQGEKIETNN